MSSSFPLDKAARLFSVVDRTWMTAFMWFFQRVTVNAIETNRTTVSGSQRVMLWREAFQGGEDSVSVFLPTTLAASAINAFLAYRRGDSTGLALHAVAALATAAIAPYTSTVLLTNGLRQRLLEGFEKNEDEAKNQKNIQDFKDFHFWRIADAVFVTALGIWDVMRA